MPLIPTAPPTRFQFALPRGERLWAGLDANGALRFNSRSREGSDHRMATDLKLDAGFNSRSREGSDRLRRMAQHGWSGFNSRSREGSDVSSLTIKSTTTRFNSRSREGSDTLCRAGRRGMAAFQFALPRGERPIAEVVFGAIDGVSIRAPARGATCTRKFSCPGIRFNSRSREGSDSCSAVGAGLTLCFNSRSREGSDP